MSRATQFPEEHPTADIERRLVALERTYKQVVIITDKLADDAVTTPKLGPAAVTNPKIGPLAVDTAEIADDAVTNPKIGLAAVDTAEIQTDAVTNPKIGPLAVDTPEIATQAVDIERMENPVHNDRGGGDASNVSLSTTQVDTASHTFTVPSWVGKASFISVHSAQITGSATHNLQIQISHGGTTGSANRVGLTADAPALKAVTFGGSKEIVAPGSTVVVKGRAKLSTGTNSANNFVITSFFSGIR